MLIKRGATHIPTEPGWYPDPSGGEFHRYFDGTGWGPHTRYDLFEAGSNDAPQEISASRDWALVQSGGEMPHDSGSSAEPETPSGDDDAGPDPEVRPS